MKNTVIQHFKNLPASKVSQFNEALQLFRKCPGKNLGQERFYNQAGYTKANLDNLNYDLKKLVNITDADIRRAAVKKVADDALILSIDSDGGSTDGGKALKIDKTFTDEELKLAEHSWKAVETKEEVFTAAPDEVKTQIKLRDEFPFLNDDNCPEEFYILVGKKFNYYDAWVKAHAGLLVTIDDVNKDDSPIAMTDEEVSAEALKAVENFEVNQSIWKELNYYKEEGKILGEHPIFIERKLKESVESLIVETATKRISNLDNYIRRDNKKAEKATTDADKEKYLKKVEEWEIELQMIKTKFNFSDKK
ncbi:MAG: hypothetical protein ACSHXA_07510 [Polaribacter sp.]|uniref:hypothetical protein n=1 Tax=Polaribacter sp. TaxID=1920175 RepID=UPI003EF961DD